MSSSEQGADKVTEASKLGVTNVAYNSSTPYVPTYVWGKAWVVSDSDATGDWLEADVTSEMLASAFDD